MKFSDDILDLFEDGDVRLVERYKISVGGRKVDGLLCSVTYLGRKVNRIEVVLVAETDAIVVLLDGQSTMTTTVVSLRAFIPFLAQAVGSL